MAFFLPIILFMFAISTDAQDNPPSPGYNPSSRIDTVAFDQVYRTLWGPQNQRFDQNSLTIWLDESSGQ
ncbi:putative xyloglucan:xyloglucosyl transferase [Helianthus annuus]|nr:putative xyloglucan:xyloglucosyl transferase [Helianthus annuus]